MKHDRNRAGRAPGIAAGETARVSRRHFLAAGAVGLGAAMLASASSRSEEPARQIVPEGLDVPLVDLHVHLDNSTIDKALQIARQRGVTLGIVEHAGTKENEYPVVLSSDAELDRYLAMLEGKPVYRGVQAEWIDWSSCFSPEALARLDYALMDAMTFPGKDGRRVKLWRPDVEAVVDMADKQAFMDRFVDWHVELIEKQPIDILGNASWLPRPLAADYDTYWTGPRVRRVAEAAAKRGVAIEISSSYKLPSRRFLEIAKAAGAKFSFGSNGRYPNMGKLDYCLQAAKELGLTKADIFTPVGDGRKPANV